MMHGQTKEEDKAAGFTNRYTKTKIRTEVIKCQKQSQRIYTISSRSPERLNTGYVI